MVLNTDALNRDYVKQTLEPAPLKTNLLALAFTLPVALAALFFYYRRWGLNFGFFGLGPLRLVGYWALLILGVLVLVALREIARAACYALAAQNGAASVELGVNWKRLAPFCRCRESLSLARYRLCCAAPFALAGLAPFAAAFFGGFSWLFIAGFCGFVGCGGDLVSLFLLRREKKGALVADLPDQTGMAVYRPKHTFS